MCAAWGDLTGGVYIACSQVKGNQIVEQFQKFGGRNEIAAVNPSGVICLLSYPKSGSLFYCWRHGPRPREMQDMYGSFRFAPGILTNQAEDDK